MSTQCQKERSKREKFTVTNVKTKCLQTRGRDFEKERKFGRNKSQTNIPPKNTWRKRLKNKMKYIYKIPRGKKLKAKAILRGKRSMKGNKILHRTVWRKNLEEQRRKNNRKR